MYPMPFDRSSFPPILCALAIVVAALSCAGAAHADPKPASSKQANSSQASTDSPREYSRYYTGAFVEYSVRGGASLATEAPYKGWNIDVGARQSFPMLVGDFRVAYRYDHLTGTGANTPGPMEQHSLGGYVCFHPLYLLMLGSDWLSYTVASLYAEFGGGAQIGVLNRPDTGDYQTHVGPFVSLGVGLDMPLADPDVGYAPWLNIVYRWHVADFDGKVETFDIDMNVLQVGIGWRINGLLY